MSIELNLQVKNDLFKNDSNDSDSIDPYILDF